MTASPSTPIEPQAIPSGRQARGRVRVPPSKSITHRYLALALLGGRPLLVERPLLAEDTRLFLAALAQIGWRVEERPLAVALAPPAPGHRAAAAAAAAPVAISCGNAGTMLRFLIAVLAAVPGRWRLDGTARLRERPVGPLVEALRRLGADIRHLGNPGCAPVEITGGTLAGGFTRLDAGDSSQFLSALLLAGLAASEPLTVEVSALTSAPYVEVTLAAARRCGGRIEVRQGEGGALTCRVVPGLLPPPRLRVEGDASAACYPAAAAALTGGSVVLEGLAADSPQGDRRFLELLAEMGAEVSWRGDEVEVRGGRLRGITADLSAMPDQVPTLAALAPFARGTTRIRNVAHLRLKESDRLSAMAGELRRLGAEVEEGPDRLDVAGTWCATPPPADPVVVETHGDHRIAMSLALAGLRRPGVAIGAPQVVAKSYPGFWQDFLGLLAPPLEGAASGVSGAALPPVHAALASSPAPAPLPLTAVRLTDRQRLAVLLEGAALLSLLERAGWWLPRGWEGARLTVAGRLAVPAAEASPGRSPRPPQEQLSELLLRLFGAAAGDSGAAVASTSWPAGGRAAPGSGLVAGRGEARRAARVLLAEWWQPLVPLPADEAVAQILAAAPWLWLPAFAASRQALAGALRGAAGDTLWVAGPGASRARLLAGCGGVAELAARLGGADARGWWEGPAPVGRLGTAGAGEAARVELAAASARRGRCEAALGALAPCRSAAARLLRARCQLQLGRLGAARATLRRLAALPLAAAEAIDAAEVAVRVLANSGELGQLPRWVGRALAAARSATLAERARAHLVAAVAAWDSQQPAAMDPHLEAARAALFDGGGQAGAAPGPGVRGGAVLGPAGQALWRWHHACGLRAMTANDGAAVVEHVGNALRCCRRGLARHEAAGLWNDLGIGRVQAGDLAGAERSFLHAQRLLATCDGPRRTTLALHNLAEVRLRRGRLQGVREILAFSTAENRRAGNLRGLTQDGELWARFELLLGRPAEAAAICGEAIARLDRRRSQWRRDVLAVLLARALGWLDRPAEAAAELRRATPAAVAELEPEERPALWAHAGDLAAARRAAADLAPAAGPLWLAVLASAPVPADAWEALAGLEAYRAARLVFDLERAAAGALLAPAPWRLPAIATLRRVGAGAMADWLEARDAGPWQALAAYAAHPAGDLAAVSSLLRRAGDPGARLTWIPAGEVREAPATGDAPPDAALLAADLAAGRLELLCRRADPALVACFALAVRDLSSAGAGAAPGALGAGLDAAPGPGAGPAPPLAPPPLTGPRRPRGRPAVEPSSFPAAAGNGLAGSSPAWRAALARLARLATADMPVLIRGESGTGKELAAREIHRAGARAHGPFLAVNCAALSESLLLSDLFGHVRGAFTGADRDRSGVFEAARGGTVLLDEIGDLPLAAQGLLLRVLQEAEVRRLGESLPRRVDVRVLAATHRDLERAVAAGSFRADLFFRLKVGAIDLPPLRERGDDVLELADLFLSRLGVSPPPRLAPAARERLRAHSWPGNVRELENVLRLAAVLAAGGILRPEHLELPASSPAAAPAAGSYHQQIESLRRQLVQAAIAAAAGNRAEAARRLGISRQALSYLERQLVLR